MKYATGIFRTLIGVSCGFHTFFHKYIKLNILFLQGKKLTGLELTGAEQENSMVTRDIPLLSYWLITGLIVPTIMRNLKENNDL